MPLYLWSKTAANNATADPTINWSEGQAPSSVNDSARAVMARVAEWRDDTSGLLVALGSGSAYTLTTNQGLPNPPNDGQMISFRPNFTNIASQTLAVDGGTAYPIQATLGVAIAAGLMVGGTPYSLTFRAASNVWLLQDNFGNPFNVPLGAILDYCGATAPNTNFVLANGQAISRTTYAAFFALVGTTFGAGDGVTTFNVPDLSNRFVAGTAMGGTQRITVAGGNFDGTILGNAGGSQNVTLTTAQIPAHTHTGTTDSGGAHTHTGTTGTESASHWHTGTTGTESAGHTHSLPDVPTPLPVGTGTSTSSYSGAAAGNTGGVSNTHTHGFISDGASNSHTHSFTTDSGGTHTHTFTTGSTGGGGSHPNIPPVMLLTKIVRVF